MGNLKIFIVAVFSFVGGYALLKAISLIATESDQPVIVVGLVIGMGLLVMVGLILKKREYYLYIYLLLFPFLAIYQKGVNLSVVFSLLFIINYKGELFSAKVFNKPLVGVAHLLILGAALVTAPFSHDFGTTKQYVLMYAAAFIFLNVFTLEINSAKKIKRVGNILIFLFFFCCLISLYQKVFGITSIQLFTGGYNTNTTFGVYSARIPSIFWDPQIAGLYFGLMIILLAGYFTTVSKSPAFFVITVLMGSLAIFFSLTRVAIIAFALGGFFVFLFQKRSLVSKVVTVLIFVIPFIFMANQYFRDSSFETSKRMSGKYMVESFNYRADLWQNGLAIFASHPLGVGLGGLNQYEAGVKIGLTNLNTYETRAGTQFESAVLDVLCSLGIFGGAGVVLLLLLFFGKGFYLSKMAEDVPSLHLSVFLMGGMICLLVCGLTSPVNRNDHVVFLFVLLLGLMNALETVVIERRKIISNENEIFDKL
ncbi:MAG: O-antigen ligase family protein [Candidatus Omnitrophica bacterium]|nr:O-antigen ligase family protein [Candidatus Omnitrophota bacterium]